MPISPGDRIGPYEILIPLGAGGMGQVYQARDTRLGRVVALKVLHAATVERPGRRQRFQTEARAISSLNHPHICALFDMGEQDGCTFLVMEYVEGETLDDRLTRGAVAAAYVLRYAIQLADALDHAHRHGVIHRDLKPSNVMLTRAGVKLLDFGLARLQLEPVTAGSTLSMEPQGLTAEGTILGTFQYMSPEQLEGTHADARTDIFALGTLIFEMATGRKAFDGPSQASLIASILTEHPPAISSARTTGGLPPALDHVVERCLAKNPDERWQSARDVLFELTWIAERDVDTPAVARERRSGTILAWSVAAAAVLVAAGTMAVHLRQAPAEAASVQLEVSLPEGTMITGLELRTTVAISPDGRHLAFIALRDGRSQVWLRSLDALPARALPGTEGALAVFWSPDSRFVGFGGSGKLQRIDPSGGLPQFICDARFETVPSWGRDGTILFDENSVGRHGIFRVSEKGGPVTQVTAVDRARDEREHFWPSFLADGVHFFYVVGSVQPSTGTLGRAVYVASLDAPDVTHVVDMDSRMTHAPPGHALYAQDGALLARAFDLDRFQFVSDPIRLVERLVHFRPSGLAEFSVSDNGALAFLPRVGASELLWFDRTGRELERVGAPRAEYSKLRLSPDGRKVAVEVTDPRTGAGDIWIYDRGSGIPTPFTSEPMGAKAPVWSGDGLHLFFRAGPGRDGPPDLYQKSADGRGARKPVIELEGVQTPLDASLDGRHLVYNEASRTTTMDLWVLPLTGPRTPKPYLTTRAVEGGALFSPDGRWLAFTSTETGSAEVYVAPLDDPGAKVRISPSGGIGPRWRRDGQELFYFTLDNTLMAVPMNLGQEVTRGVPRPLFTPGPVFRLSGGSVLDPAYDVSADGQRFLVNRVLEDASRAPITVILNWPALLRK